MKRFLTLVVALCLSTMAMAQKSESYFSLSGVAKSGTSLGEYKGLYSLEDAEVVFGYHFNDKWAVTVPFTGSLELNTKFQTYTQQLYLGLGGEYSFLIDKNSRCTAYASVQSSLTKRDLGGAMAYDFGVRDEFEGVQISVGFRYLDMYKSYVPNQWYLYTSFGFTLFSK